MFYVGKGNDDRLFDHFGEADKALANNLSGTPKRARIADIWKRDLDVEWWVVRYNLQAGTSPPVDVFNVEAALIDVLEISQNGPALNDMAGHGVVTRGILSQKDVEALGAPTVNPSRAYPTVFVFPIQKELAKGTPVYDATKCCWELNHAIRNAPEPVDALAVGVANGVSGGVFSILRWGPCTNSDRWEFSGTEIKGRPNVQSWGQANYPCERRSRTDRSFQPSGLCS